jgi:Zn-dependent M28 family amino/carboxypeptidase
MTVAAMPSQVSFSGASALEYTRQAVAFGPRPPGSLANRKLQAHIKQHLKTHGWEVLEDAFQAGTPAGKLPMNNLIGRKRGGSGRAVAFTGHFDTKLYREFRFVGANDGGASTGFLMEMARVLGGQTQRDDVYLVWFDGEEALGEWSATDGVHGSRHLAARWALDGTIAKIKALINVDMIGDKDLNILLEMNSTAWLRQLVWQTARDTGYGRYFLETGGAIEDDHAPFLKAGAPALDLIDFDYGPHDGTYWHTAKDTMDKLSAHSLQVVGDVLVEALRRLEKRP